MTKFSKRYILREEHHEIVEYYRRLVDNLQCDLVDLRSKREADPMESVMEHGRRVVERQLRQAVAVGGNVVIGNSDRQSRG